jgi:hypothetical protein
MRISSIASLAVAAAGLAGASPLDLFGGKQSTITGNGLKIPGESPLELCPKSHDDDILTVESVDLLPNPPLAGKELVIKAVGSVTEKIEEGAYVLLQIKYGLIRIISTKADLCEQIKNVDMECPIEPGVITVTKAVSLPNEIPPVSPTSNALFVHISIGGVSC